MNDDKLFIPDYSSLLKDFNYNKKEIERYFDILIDSLKKEIISSNSITYKEIDKLYLSYENYSSKYFKVRYDLINSYLDEFEVINKRFNDNKESAFSTFTSNKNELLDKIELEKIYINKIKHSILLKYYELKKPFDRKNKEIYKSLDEEYYKHLDTILKSKEKINKHEEYYNLIDSHIKDIDNTISFLLKLKNDVVSLPNRSNNEIFSNEYFNKYKDSIDNELSSIDLLIKNENIYNDFTSIKNTIIKLKNSSDFDYIKYSSSIKEKISNINKEIESINNSNLDKKKKKLLVNSLTDAKVVLSQTLYSNKNNIDSINNLLVDFIDEINKKDQIIQKTFNNDVINSVSYLKDTFSTLKEFINNSIDSLNETKNNILVTNKKVDSILKNYDSLEIDNRVLLLNQYKEYLLKMRDKNKYLDCISFELLTSEELMKIKVLDIKKQFLTIDNTLSIKEIECDMKIEEFKEFINPSEIIRNTVNDIKLLENDYKTDLKLFNENLEKETMQIDLKNKIDSLRSDYMVAYERLNNIINISKVQLDKKLKNSSIQSKIDLLNTIKNILLDTISFKESSDKQIKRYQKDIHELNFEKDSKISYLNDVLEIEINNYNEGISNLIKDLNTKIDSITPSLKHQKEIAGVKINKITNFYNNKKNELISNNQKLIDNIKMVLYKKDEFIKKIDECVSSYIDSLNYDNKSIKDFVLFELNSTIENLLSISQIISIETYEEFKDFSSSFLNKISKEKSFNYNSFKKALNLVDKSFTSIINNNKTYSSDEINNMLSKYDAELKDKIAKIVLNNTVDIEPYLIKKDDYKNNTVKAKETLSKKLNEYKKTYIQKIDEIKKEYSSSILQIEIKKDSIEASNNNLPSNMNNVINECIDLNNEISLKKENDIKNEHENIVNSANYTIKALSDDIRMKNLDFTNRINEINHSKAQYIGSVTDSSIEYFKEIKKNQEIENDKNRIKLKELNNQKESYLTQLRNQSLLFKDNYEKIIKNIEEDCSLSLIDKQEKYTKAFNKLLDESNEMSGLITSTISNSLNQYKNEIEKIDKEVNSSIKESVSSIYNVIDKMNKDILDK